MSKPTLLRRAAGVSAALAATTAIGLAAAGPAAAETQNHQDPRGDVAKIDTARATKAKPGIDIVRVTNTFKGSNLTLSMDVQKLLKKGYAAEWFIDTTEGSTYILVYNYTGAEPEIQFGQVAKSAPRVAGPTRGIGTCQGIKVKPKGDTITGTVPRSCIGGADAVRVASITVQPTNAGLKADDGRQKGIDGGDDIKFGPKLKRN